MSSTFPPVVGAGPFPLVCKIEGSKDKPIFRTKRSVWFGTCWGTMDLALVGSLTVEASGAQGAAQCTVSSEGVTAAIVQEHVNQAIGLLGSKLNFRVDPNSCIGSSIQLDVAGGNSYMLSATTCSPNHIVLESLLPSWLRIESKGLSGSIKIEGEVRFSATLGYTCVTPTAFADAVITVLVIAGTVLAVKVMAPAAVGYAVGSLIFVTLN